MTRRSLLRALVAVATLATMAGLTTYTAHADWVPAAVPEQTRFVVAGDVADYREGDLGLVYTEEFVLAPVTAASPSAAPYVADGEAVIDLTLVSELGYDYEYLWYLWQDRVNVRVYGFLVPDPRLSDGARFVADRIEETAAVPDESGPVSVDPEAIVDSIPGGVQLGDVEAALISLDEREAACMVVFAPPCYQPTLNTGLIAGDAALGTFTMATECYYDEPVGLATGEVYFVGLDWSIDDVDGSHLEGSSTAWYPQTTATILTLYTEVADGSGTGRWAGADGAGWLQFYGTDGCPTPFAQPGRITLDLTP